MDKKQMQLDYEVFGKSVEEIAETHNVSQHLVNYVVQEQGWTRLPMSSTLNSWKHTDNPEEELLDQVSKAAQLYRALQESDLNPKIMVVRQSIIEQCRKLVPATESPRDLKMLAEILQMLEPKTAQTPVDSGMKILIMNKFGDAPRLNGSTANPTNLPEPITITINGSECEIEEED